MKRSKWLSRLDLNQCNDGVKVRCRTAWLLDNIGCSSVRAVKRPSALSYQPTTTKVGFPYERRFRMSAVLICVPIIAHFLRFVNTLQKNFLNYFSVRKNRRSLWRVSSQVRALNRNSTSDHGQQPQQSGASFLKVTKSLSMDDVATMDSP